MGVVRKRAILSSSEKALTPEVLGRALLVQLRVLEHFAKDRRTSNRGDSCRVLPDAMCSDGAGAVLQQELPIHLIVVDRV